MEERLDLKPRKGNPDPAVKPSPGTAGAGGSVAGRTVAQDLDYRPGHVVQRLIGLFQLPGQIDDRGSEQELFEIIR